MKSALSYSSYMTNLRSIAHMTYWEFKRNLLSGRMVIGVFILTFSIVAGSMGISAMSLRPEAAILPSELHGTKASFVLYLVSFMTAMFGSIMVLILSFDTFSRDRENGAAQVLLSRPITRRGIALSKFLGIFLAVGISVVMLLQTSVSIIENTVGETLPLEVKLWYTALTLALFASMILIQMLLSLAARNAGSAIMYGVSVWFLYTIFWLMISLSVAQWMGLQPTEGQTAEDFTSTMQFAYISNRVDLFNPIGAFHLCSGILLAGQDEVITVPHMWPYAALALWVLIPLLAVVEIYNRQDN